jgi:hypothetical protein
VTIVHAAKVIARMQRRIERKIEDILGYQIGYRRGREIGMPKRTSERNLDMEEELCACSILSQKIFDSVIWTKLMQILKGNVIDWREKD